jgi:hypothetical protein
MLDSPVLLSDVHVTSGRLAVVTTTSPRADVQSPFMCCYAVLTSWRSKQDRVGMLVTFVRMSQLTVNLVYADPAFRKERTLVVDGEEQVRATVAVGQWLFGSGRLEKHSVERNAKGDRWAHDVSVDPSPRDESLQQEFDSSYWGAQFLASINNSALPAFPALPLHREPDGLAVGSDLVDLQPPTVPGHFGDRGLRANRGERGE